LERVEIVVIPNHTLRHEDILESKSVASCPGRFIPSTAVPIRQMFWWVPELVWAYVKNLLSLSGIDRPNRSLATAPTELRPT
jgi:hypothetical protein